METETLDLVLSREIAQAKIVDNDLDFAFNLQMKEAITASLSHPENDTVLSLQQNSHQNDTVVDQVETEDKALDYRIEQDRERTEEDGPVAILWDIENCNVPSDVRAEDVAGNIRMALRVHPVIKGNILMFSAYGDFNPFPRRLREGCQRTGVKLIDVPNGRKDAADKAILVDMFLFALDNPPPSSIMLISGDVDFAPALHILGQRGYTVILVVPSGVGVSSALRSAGKFIWDWPSVARGEGFLPPSRSLMGCRRINDGGQNEEPTMHRGLPRYSSSVRSPTLPPSCIDDGLKMQLTKLLELSGGCLPLTSVPTEYLKMYGRPLYVSEYGASKLVNLFKKMGDAMAVDGEGQKKFVYLRNWEPFPTAPPAAFATKDRKGKGTQEESLDAVFGWASSEFSVHDEERVVVEEEGESFGDAWV